jgi:uncharacterized protein YbjT (DUF2867 family)
MKSPDLNEQNSPLPKIAIAGAGGFVGEYLRKQLREHFSIIALGRSQPSGSEEKNTEWRLVDLFSAGSVAEVLKGADVGIYLVHSMMPSSKLFQGDFHDTDLLLADNFANACRLNGVKQIIYLGGLLPEGYVSSHLQSRHEVERVLDSSGVDLTVFRAGMIVGPGGSSFEILRSLVKKLPIMILPKWTERNTQAVFIDDVVDTIQTSILNPAFKRKTFNLVNGEALTYKLLLEISAKVLGVKRYMFPVPIASTGFSKLWVQIFGNSPRELVSPLIDSLVCDLPQLQPEPEVETSIKYKSFESMFIQTNLLTRGKSTFRKKRKKNVEPSVRSIQRLPSVNQDAHWIAMEYMKWLPSFLPQVLRVEIKEAEKKVNFFLRFFSKPLLELTFVKNSLDLQREKFHITGGILTKTNNTGWLEFRQLDHRKFNLVSIHEFYPRLPWLLYRFTQAPLHRIVMLAFGRHLKRIAELET